MTSTTTASKCIPKRHRICINWNPPFQTQIYLVKVPLNVNIVKQDLLSKKQFLTILWSEVWNGGLQLIQILGLLGMYFDDVVVEVQTFLLLFRLALVILCFETFDVLRISSIFGKNVIIWLPIYIFKNPFSWFSQSWKSVANSCLIHTMK